MGGSYSQASYDKDRYTEPYMASQPPDAAKGKVVAVTGATGNGLGLKFAMTAAKLGAAKVILMNRESERATKAVEAVRAVAPSDCVVSSIDCDLTSLDSVRAAGPKLAAESGGLLDVLMLNSGIMASPDGTTADGYNREAQVNNISQMLLLKAAMPLLEAAADARGEARVVQQSSAARWGEPPIVDAFFDKVPADGLPAPLKGDAAGGMFGMGPAWQRYHQTKLANSLSTMILHDKLQAKGSKVKAVCVAPGLAATDLQATTNTTGNMKAWETNLIFMLAGQSANDGALPMIHACLMPGIESGSIFEPARFGGMNGLPAAVAIGGQFLPGKAKADKHTIATPETRASFWAMMEAACGGPIV